MSDIAHEFTFGIADVVRRKQFLDIFNPLREHGNVVNFDPFDEMIFQEKISEIDVLLIRILKINAATLKKAKRLKAVIKAGVGTDHIDVEVATQLGIHVIISLGNHISVAESAMLLMLSISRNLIKLNKCTIDVSKLLGTETYGKTLGIVGFGRIGKHLCQIASGFDMKVLVYDPIIDKVNETEVTLVTFKQLLNESDYISLHCPLNAETHHMIGINELKAMKPNAILINTARGGIIDEKSLYLALKDNIIAGAGLDVIEEASSENNLLFQLPNVIITPHRLCQTSESISRQMRSMLQSAISIRQEIVPEESINKSKIK
jgi:D-3-phosphoglycerate dehydrogenase / 2-oxoglutarate reductase